MNPIQLSIEISKFLEALRNNKSYIYTATHQQACEPNCSCKETESKAEEEQYIYGDYIKVINSAYVNIAHIELFEISQQTPNSFMVEVETETHTFTLKDGFKTRESAEQFLDDFMEKLNG